MRRKRSIARSRRRNGRCEFSARLFNQRPVSCLPSAPISFSAAPYDRSRSVTIISGWPCLRIAFFKNFRAAFLSRVFVTKLSKRYCQTNSNSSLVGQRRCPLCRAKFAPLGKSGGACQLEGVSAGERSFLVEVVVHGGMDGGEFL